MQQIVIGSVWDNFLELGSSWEKCNTLSAERIATYVQSWGLSPLK